MNRVFHRKQGKRIRRASAGKRGFTILETMISIAILLILTLIMYQGFVSLFQYSVSTSIFEKSSDTNAGTVNTFIAGTQSANHNGTITLSYASCTGNDPHFTSINIFVLNVAINPATPGGPAYQEGLGAPSTHRYGFVYRP